MGVFAIKIGLSLISYENDKIINFDNDFKKIGINFYEIPHICFINDYSIFSSISVFSVHANKKAFFFNLKKYTDYLYELKFYCKKVGCNKIVFHPNENMEITMRYIELIYKLLDGFEILFENTVGNLAELSRGLIPFGYNLVYDLSHGAFHGHNMRQYDNLISYYHVRGFNKKKRYVPLYNNIDFYKELYLKKGKTYVLEYRYKNTLEIYRDIRTLIKLQE